MPLDGKALDREVVLETFGVHTCEVTLFGVDVFSWCHLDPPPPSTSYSPNSLMTESDMGLKVLVPTDLDTYVVGDETLKMVMWLLQRSK